MSDQSPSEYPGDDDPLCSLFVRHLQLEALPVEASERLVQRVLAEVQNVYVTPTSVPKQAPGHLDRFRNWLGGLRPVQSLALAGAGAVLIMLLIVGVSRITPRPLAAVTTVAGGDATVLRAHNGSFRTYHDGDVLKVQQGDHILTASAVVTVSQFADQVAVIGPSAHVEIAQLDDANGGTQVDMVVHAGQVRADIGAHLDANDRYVIHAPGITVTAHGTVFSVEAIADDETIVTAFEGEVEVQMGDQFVSVGPGEEVDAIIGGALLVGRADGQHDGGPTPILVAVDAADELHLLAAPQASAPWLGKLLAGRTFQIEEQDPTGEWYRVCCVGNQSGWVRVPAAKPAE